VAFVDRATGNAQALVQSRSRAPATVRCHFAVRHFVTRGVQYPPSACGALRSSLTSSGVDQLRSARLLPLELTDTPVRARDAFLMTTGSRLQTNKAGIIAMTRQLAMEGREHAIRAASAGPRRSRTSRCSWLQTNAHTSTVVGLVVDGGMKVW
jgi:NAD(P)-dependent dehydrogenase (short-subunit alcohol dehydrogenase family)